MKKLIIPILLLTFTVNSFAQRNGKMQERIQAQKIAFITDRLNLSTEEAQKFWPIYNAYEDKTENIRKNDLQEVREAMRRGNLSDSEAHDLLTKFMAAEEKMHQAKIDLVKDLRNAIPPQKIIALKAAEEAFRRKLIEIMRQQREKMQQKRNRN